MGIILCGLFLWLAGVHLDIMLSLNMTGRYDGMIFITVVDIMINYHK